MKTKKNEMFAEIVSLFACLHLKSMTVSVHT